MPRGYDLIGKDGYVCTVDTVREAERLIRLRAKGSPIVVERRVFTASRPSDKKNMVSLYPDPPFVIRPHARLNDKPLMTVSKTTIPRVSKKIAENQPVLELDGFNLLEETHKVNVQDG